MSMKYEIKEVSTRQKYFWNMMGSLCNAFSTIILLLLVNRILGTEAGGIFSFAYSNAQMMMIIGGLEVRPIQTTDVEEKYSFKVYFSLRIITCILMMCVSTGYALFSGYEIEKLMIVISFTAFKAVESFSDVIGGMYQQHDRIDLMGKTFSLRVIFSTILFGLFLLGTHNLLAGSAAMVTGSFALIFLNDLRYINLFPTAKIGFGFDNIVSLIKEVIPLFIAAFIMSYISNAPKYAIDIYCSNVLQNKYSILFMPAFVINLFSLFFFRPVLVDMTRKWNQHDVKGLINYIKKSVLFIIFMTIICLSGGILLGIPVLSYIYGVDLSGEELVLAVVMIYGGLCAFSTYFYYVITVMRVQSKILIGYIAAFMIVAAVSPGLVRNLQLIGAAITSAVAALSLDIIFVIIIIVSIKKQRKDMQ